MGYFKELDLIIMSKCNYDPITRENEPTYQQFKDEISEHLQGKVTFEQLSPLAQDAVAEWEGMIEGDAQNAAKHEAGD